MVSYFLTVVAAQILFAEVCESRKGIPNPDCIKPVATIVRLDPNDKQDDCLPDARGCDRRDKEKSLAFPSDC